MTNPDVPGGRIRFGLMSPKDRAGPTPFGPGGALTGVLVVALVVGGLCWSAVSGRPVSADRPSLFAGSLVLEDTRPLTVINVATAQVTVRLESVNAQVGAAADGDVQPVRVDGGTVLVNRLSGSFNFLDADNYVSDPGGPGVGLGPLTGSTGAVGYASGPDAYIIRSAPASTVSLVGRPTVVQAAQSQRGGDSAPAAVVRPLGFASLAGSVGLQTGAAAVSGRNLWVLVAEAGACRVVELDAAPESRQGLVPIDRGSSPSCGSDALEAAAGVVGLAAPGRVRLYRGPGRPSDVAVPSTAGASRILPVAGTTSELWFLADLPGGWDLVGVQPSGRVAGPYPLAQLGPSADPVAPVMSGAFLYTLDQSEGVQPTLWTIDAVNGRMAPLRGTPRYPLFNGSERSSFEGTQLLVDGPRVVFNNPQSLEALVVFTDGSRLPVAVDKSEAVVVSATGPADLAPQVEPTPAAKGGAAGNPVPSPIPVVQPVSRQISCADTTQKPYAPQITAVTPSSSTALIQWSYQLLDQTDCEPDTWMVQVRALSGSHQPSRPLQVVSGQDQYLFPGLRPVTTYQVVVEAVINQQTTASSPATFMTTARGPDAPLSVHTHADVNGDWVVSWVPCAESTRPDCVVPADAWTVTGAACNGSFVGSPPAVQVAGGQSEVTISAGQLRLLGTSLSFTVQGSLTSGLTGDPTGDGSCTEAFEKPDAAAISLDGQAAQDAEGGTVTATLTVLATGDPESVFGVPVAQAQFLYSLTSGSVTRTVGPAGRISVSVPGLPPAVTFTPSVLIYPAGHPDAAVTVTGSPFQRTLSWPDLSQTEAKATVDTPGYNTGLVTVTLPESAPAGPLSAVAATSDQSPGAGPQIQCGGPGGAVEGYPVQAVSQARELTFPMNDLVDEGGDCTVSFSLIDGADPNPYGGPSAPITEPFTIGRQPAYGFSFTYLPCGDPLCSLGKAYTIEVDATDPFAGGGAWTVTTGDPNLPSHADLCHTQTDDSAMPDRLDVQIPPACPQPDQLDVSVRWRYLGQEQSVMAAATNSPPTTTPPPATTTTTASTTTTSSTSTTTSSTSSTTSSTTSTTTSTTTTTTKSGAPPVAGTAAGAGLPIALLGAAWVIGEVRRNVRKARRGRG